jgi:hypothetical protein
MAITKPIKTNILAYPLIINPQKIIFYTIFLLVFCFSGIITMLDIVPYRMGVVSLLALPLIIISRPKVDNVLIVYGLLTLTILLSALSNRSSLLELALFMRILLFSYLIYYLVNKYISQDNIVKIFRFCIVIALIQLPIVLLQFATYDLLPAYLQAEISATDYDFGTFNFKGDSSMTFFLILIIIFLLFDQRRKYVVKKPIPIILWLSATVLITNAEMSKIILMLVWVVFLITHLNRKLTIYLMFTSLILLLSLYATGQFERIINNQQMTVQGAIDGFDGDPDRVERYLRGGYSRGGAIYYYLNQDILWLGDGPTRYSNPIERVRLRGNVGHIFTFYSEVGLIGWFLSMLVFFCIAFNLKTGRLRLSLVPIVTFISIFLLSFTNQIMNDISVVMIFAIMSKSHLISLRGSD